jgi:hypothetical protein
MEAGEAPREGRRGVGGRGERACAGKGMRREGRVASVDCRRRLVCSARGPLPPSSPPLPPPSSPPLSCQVHGDVFRPPPLSSLLCSMVGTGVQLFGMIIVVMVFAVLGFLSPANRCGGRGREESPSIAPLVP